MTLETANRLCEYRKAHGLSQEQLAERVGVSRQAISKWERAEASPDTDNLITLSKIYGITLDELINHNPTESGEPVYKEADRENPDNKVGDDGGVNSCLDSIPVDEANGGEDEAASPFLKRWNSLPYPMMCVAAYLLMGFFDVLGGFGLGWLVFLTIPLYYTLGSAVDKRDPARFAYPVLVTIGYLYAGLVYGKWHPMWIVFLTVPFYYAFFNSYKNKEN